MENGRIEHRLRSGRTWLESMEGVVCCKPRLSLRACNGTRESEADDKGGQVRLQ